jgi:hypothetical protein
MVARYRPKTNDLSASDARHIRIALHQLRTTQQVLNSAARNCEAPYFYSVFGTLMLALNKTLSKLEEHDD